MKINIKFGSHTCTAIINDTTTGRLIYDALPIKGRVSRWGREIYFPIPVDTGLEAGASDVVSIGSLGYWPTGQAFCIFFGRTPISQGDEIRAASAVNVFGRVESGIDMLDHVEDGAEVTIEKMAG